MSKIFALVVGVAVVAAVSAPTYAGVYLANGLTSNGLSTNGLSSNGLTTNGLTTNGRSTNGLGLQAVRLVMPDGAELGFR